MSPKQQAKPASIAAFEKMSQQRSLTPGGTSLGVLHRGYMAQGTGAAPFQKDEPLDPTLIPKGTKAIELVSVVAVVEFLDERNLMIDVPLAGWQTWAWCAKNASGKWFSRIHVDFVSPGKTFTWWIGLNQSFFF